MIIPETEIIITKDGAELARATVKPGDYVIGSGQGADIVVQAEEIADRHAMLTVNYHELFIEDLGSGRTSVAGRPVTECTRIWPTQKVRIGSSSMEARRVKASHDTGLSLAPETALVRDLLPAEFLREKKYDIGGLVAQDSMGEMVDAFEATTGRTVAMKVMLSSLSEEEILRFVAEAQITSQLEHPNIIPVHELGVDEEDHVFYTMKLVRGVTLKKILKKIADGDPETIAQYPLAELLTVFQKICDAVAFAHSRTVIHRQLKPSNVTIGEYGEVLVMNWGNAKFLWSSPGDSAGTERAPARGNSTSTLARVGADSGPGSARAPDKTPTAENKGADPLDPQEDILALGAILYQILGQHLPAADHPAAPPSAAGLPGRRIPHSLVAVAKKARSADAGHRYASVPELQADITAYQDGYATSAEQASLWKQLVLLVGRHKGEAMAFAASFAVLLALGLGAYAYVARERNAALFESQRAEQQRIEAERQRMQAATERTGAESERERAERTLSDLSTAAPAYHRQGTALIQVQKFAEALESIGFAIALAPDNPDYLLFQANTLQAMQRLPEAVDSYRRVLALRPADAAAKTNLELCQRLLTAAAGNPLSKPQQTELLHAIVAQKRAADEVFLASALTRQEDGRFAKIKEQLAPATQQPKWNDGRLARRDDGTVTLDLSDLALPDLALLRDLPVSALNIARTGVSDLTPLATLPLTKLDCAENPLADLSPLKGKALEELSLRDCAVTDVAVLRGMPLETLNLAGLPISSIDALRGMPLRRLDLFGCSQLADFSPLTTLAALDTLNLPAQFTDLALVKQLRSLQRLGSGDFGAGVAAFDKVPTVATFLAAYGQRLAVQSKLGPRLEQLRQALRQIGAPESKIAAVAVGGDGFMDLDLTALPLDNLSVLSGLPVRRLVIKSTKISDLNPLRGLPLTTLDASDTPIKDLTPLAACPNLISLDVSQTGITDLRPLAALKLDRLAVSKTAVHDLAPLQRMPLRELYFDDTKVEEVFSLATCTALESITISRTVRDPNLLRKLPALQRISNTRDALQGRPAQSAAEFWAAYDSSGKTRETEARLNAALAKLRALDGWKEDRFQKQADGTYKFDLSNLHVNDLTFLRELPISSLSIQSTEVTRIRPIADCPIRDFHAYGCFLTDLAVLGQWPLERLDLVLSGPGDLKSLRGLKLRWLNISPQSGPVFSPDLGPLKGMPLEYFRAPGFQGLSLTALEGAPIKELSLSNAQLKDLGPVRHMPVNVLYLDGAQVPDISPLRNLPLTHIDLLGAVVRDVSPLADCKALESIILPHGAKGVEKLRKLPNLKQISYEANNITPSLTAEQFWAEFDKQKKP